MTTPTTSCRLLPLKSCLLAFAWALIAVAIPTTGRALSIFGGIFPPDVKVVTVTDMTDAGRLLRQPSRQHPIYYEAMVFGYTDFGNSVAGLVPPDKMSMLKLILKLLADRGYYPGTHEHRPEILIVLRWGTMNGRLGMALPFLGGDKLDLLWQLEPMNPSNIFEYQNEHMHGKTADIISSISKTDLYVISIQAYDEAAAFQGIKKLLWHTKVSCPADGLDLAPTLRQMAHEAAAYIGRETDRPILTHAPPREGHVDLKELRIIETIDPKKLPIIDATNDDQHRSSAGKK